MNSSNVIWLIRPWIFDFSAYDHFAQPLGLLILASYLRNNGFEVIYLDCLSRKTEKLCAKTEIGSRIIGPYSSEVIEKPEVFKGIPRYFKRYGITEAEFQARLMKSPTPNAILITSSMTYWFGGIQATINEIKKIYPHIPIALGGIYASICPEHARKYSGADFVFPGKPGISFSDWLANLFHCPVHPASNLEMICPSWDLVRDCHYAVLISSIGCLYRCRYCGSSCLNDQILIKTQTELQKEIEYILSLGIIHDIAFYDDALAGETHIINFLDFLRERNYPVRWHIPNAISASQVTPEIADLLLETGFIQPRLSIYHLDLHLGENGLDLAAQNQFRTAAENLRKSGYETNQISAYLIAGLPGQKLKWIKTACQQLFDINIKPYPSLFSPVPGTDLGDQRLKELGYYDSGELLLTNKIFSVFRHSGWSSEAYKEFSAEIRTMRNEEM